MNRRFVRCFNKLFLGVFLFLFFFVSVFVLFLNNPFFNRYLCNKTSHYLSQRLDADVSIGSFELGLSNTLRLNNFRLVNKDTILSFETLSTKLSYSKLFNKEIRLTYFYLKNAKSEIGFDKNNILNIQFLIDSFTPKSQSSKSEWKFSISHIDVNLANIDFTYYSKRKKIVLKTGVQLAKIKMGQSNLNDLILHCNQFDSKGLYLDMNLNLDKYTLRDASLQGNNIWINPLGFEYFSDEVNIQFMKASIDFDSLPDLFFSEVSLNSELIQVYNGDYSADVKSLTFNKFNTYQNITLSTVARFTYSEFISSSIKLITERSNINISSHIIYNNLDKLSDLSFQKESFINIQSSIDLDELKNVFSFPELNYLSSNFNISTVLQGNKNKVLIKDLSYLDANNNEISISGIVDSIDIIESAKFDLLINSNLSTALIDSFVDYNVLEQNIQMLSFLKGNLNDFMFNSGVTSDAGESILFLQSNINYPQFSSKVNFINFPINIIVGDSLFIGDITLNSSIQSSDITYSSSLRTEGSLDLKSVEINRVNYNNYNINWKLLMGKANVNLTVDDSLLGFRLESEIDIKNNYLHISSNSQITKFDPHYLSDTISIENLSSKIHFDYTKSFDAVNYDILFEDSKIKFNNKSLLYEDIIFKYIKNKNVIRTNFSTEKLSLDLETNISRNHLQNYFISLSNRYIVDDDSLIVFSVDSIKPFFNMKFKLKKFDPLLNYYTSGFINFPHADIQINSSLQNGINLSLYIPSYSKSNVNIYNLKVELNDSSKLLTYHIKLDSLLYNTIPFHQISCVGILSDSLVTVDLESFRNDSIENKIYFSLEKHLNKIWDISLHKDWILYNNIWKISGDGIQTDFRKVSKANVSFTKGRSVFIIDSDTSNVLIHAQNIFFNKRMANYIQLPFTGIINLDLKLNKTDIGNSKYYVSAEVDSLMNDTILFGNLIAKLETGNHHQNIKLNAILKRDNSETQITGDYDIKQSLYNTNINLTSFPLSLADPFVEAIGSITGLVNGTISSRISPQKHDLSTNLIFKDNSFKYIPLSSEFKIKEGILKSNKDKISLDFLIIDNANDEAEVKGVINLLEEQKLDLLLTTNKFILMDNDQESNEEFNGKLIVSTKSTVGGTLSEPQILSFISLEKGTEINILNKDNLLDNSSVNSDVVKLNFTKDSIQTTVIDKDTANQINASIKANISIDNATELRIIFDPVNQDYLTTTGGGNLSYEITESGAESLTGTYEVQKGTYKITFQELISKSFEIGSNSSIIWVGEKENPELKLNTYYNFRTSPYALMSNQGTMSDKEKDIYSGMHDFRLKMNINGTLEKPELTFKIEDVEDNNTNAFSNIGNELDRINNDPSALNQNVFSILLFNKFISSSESIGSNTDVIINSLGQLVTAELNRLTSEYIDFVDIAVGFNAQSNENYEGSQSYNTSVDLKIEKSFYNDRIRVKVGGVWDTHQNTESTGNSNKAWKNDFSIEYLITKDGRYLAKIYNKDDKDYDGTDVTRNGISVSYSKNFNKLRYIFKKPEDIRIEDE